MPADLHVAVVGGGIGGLTLAIALEQRGVPVAVFEQAPEFREIGAGVALSANGTRHLHRLGLGDALDSVSVEPGCEPADRAREPPRRRAGRGGSSRPRTAR